MSARRRARPVRRGPRLDPRREIVLHYITEGPARGWLHTHGLAVHGRPELEIRNVPLFLRGAAANLLNDLADYLLNDAAKPLVAGELIDLGGTTSLQVVAAGGDAEAGYDPAHYDGYIRLTVGDAPPTGCECEECAREYARRSRLPN
jgi:hypothetical protein